MKKVGEECLVPVCLWVCIEWWGGRERSAVRWEKREKGERSGVGVVCSWCVFGVFLCVVCGG